MSRHTVQIFLYELRRNLRRKGFLFATFGLPLLTFVLTFGYQAINSLPSDNQPLQDIERLQESFRGIEKAGYVDLSDLLPADPGAQLRQILISYPNEVAAQAALQAGDINVYYVIAADYLETGDVTLVMSHMSLNQITSAPIEQLIVNTLQANADPNLIERLRSPSTIQEINVQRDLPEGVTQDEGTQFGTVYIFSILFLMSVFVTNGYLMQSVIEEKETRLIEILISTVRPIELLGGKILALGTLGLLQIAVWLSSVFLLIRLMGSLPALATSFISNIFLAPEFLPLFLIYFVLGYLLFAAAYGAVGALSNSLQEGPQYAVIFTIPAVIPFYFFSLFAQSPDGPLPTILSLFPLTAPLAMVMRVTISSVPAWQIILSIVLLILADIGMIWLAGRLFRVNTLLAGRMPKLREIPRLLRG